MSRATGTYRVTAVGGEQVKAFVPHPLPPTHPALAVDDVIRDLSSVATASIARLSVAGAMVPSADWFIYGFVRKEAVVSSQIEGTQATLEDVLNYEATEQALRPDDVQEVCNYVDALTYCRREISRPKGLPLSSRLLCQAHKRLMKGVRGHNKQPGEIRRSQNWVGGTRPGNAVFVPPPPEIVPDLMASLDRWLHSDDTLPPLIKAGLAHVQFETIHPFLDGNGRIGRLLVTLLVEHWGLLNAPILYLSLPLKRYRSLYYEKLAAVRSAGDWEGWTRFFLECVREAADDGVTVAQALFARINQDREALARHDAATVSAIRLFDQLPRHPIVTLQRAVDLVGTSKPTALKAIAALVDAGVLRETTGKQRDRVYAYHHYLEVLTRDTEPANPIS
ncbi:MAG: Fic family protein [Phycisphaeraceae bacterium]|nr:Fic family protein [Phycisphaeraceae bacterium]